MYSHVTLVFEITDIPLTALKNKILYTCINQLLIILHVLFSILENGF